MLVSGRVYIFPRIFVLHSSGDLNHSYNSPSEFSKELGDLTGADDALLGIPDGNIGGPTCQEAGPPQVVLSGRNSSKHPVFFGCIMLVF